MRRGRVSIGYRDPVTGLEYGHIGEEVVAQTVCSVESAMRRITSMETARRMARPAMEATDRINRGMIPRTNTRGGNDWEH